MIEKISLIEKLDKSVLEENWLMGLRCNGLKDVYRTPFTRTQDTKFGSPGKLLDAINSGKGISLWNKIGNLETEESMDKLLYLSSILDYFVAIPKNVFLEATSRMDVSLEIEKPIEIRKLDLYSSSLYGEFISLGNKALEKCYRSAKAQRLV